MKTSFENITNELLKNKIRPSFQRLKIMEYLINQKCHPTVDQIFNDLIKEVPTLSKATIYNTLTLFVKAKLVRVITIEDTETRYDISTSNHGHFKCELCGNIFDFKVDIDNFTTNDLDEFKINEKNIYFKGICPRCLKDKKTVKGE